MNQIRKACGAEKEESVEDTPNFMAEQGRIKKN
jgi:hypothetical protein